MRPQRTLVGPLALTAVVGLLGGCAYAPPDDPYIPAPPMWGSSPSTQVIRVYEEPPLVQPATVFIDVAPPPMMAEVRPMRPSYDAVWIGGYWGWQSRWVWVRGRWAPPPRPGYVWTNPYYENRGGGVVFVPGFWRGPGAVFAPPPHHPRTPPGPPHGQGGRRATTGPEWSRPVAPLPVTPVPGPAVAPPPAPAEARPPNEGRRPGSPPRRWGGPAEVGGRGEQAGQPSRVMVPRAERADPPRQPAANRPESPRREADGDHRGDRRSDRRPGGWGGRKKDEQQP